MRPMGIGETILWALAKLVMRAAGDQSKISCGNLQMCPGLKASIEVATHDVGQRSLEKVKARRHEGEEAGDYDEEEESQGLAACLNKLTIETAGTEEEAAEKLEDALEMEIEETCEGEEGGDGTQREMGDLDFLTRDSDPNGTTLVDARNGFNELSRLAILWTVRHRGTSESRVALN